MSSMLRFLAECLLAVVLAGCSASGPGAPGPADAGGTSEVPPLRQVLAPGNIALLHAAVLDPDTGATSILNYIVVDDFGATLNPLLLAGQVHGGAVQGIGQALMESTVYDPASGQLLSASFMDYAMPRAGDAPDFVFETRNVPCKTNPLGVKGAGEAGAIGSCPAVMNAIVDALWRAHRIRHVDMPATPQRIWQAIRSARTSTAA